MKSKAKKTIILFLCLFLAILITYTCYKLVLLFISLKDPLKQEKFKTYIANLGWKGWIALLIIQILQIFIAFIPGEIIELLSGILYGAVGGLLICLLGIIIGSTLIYCAMKLLANKYISKYKEKLQNYNFLKNKKKTNIYLFTLFFIPGIPKDILIYFAPFLPISFPLFLLISSIARIPSILSSTIIGDSLIQGNYILSIVIFVIFAILGILGILFSDKIISIFNKKNKISNNENIVEK